MAKYNTFIAQSTKGKTLLVTSSARKARQQLQKGVRVEVWNENQKVETIYTRTRARLDTYVTAEKDYIRNKQAAAEHRNKMRRARRNDRHA